MGTSKVYILDKYFNELQKFWDTEKRLQGNSQSYLLKAVQNYQIFDIIRKSQLLGQYDCVK